MKVLITRPKNQSATFGADLQTAGFEPVYFPVIEIRPIEDNTSLDQALSKLNCYDWIVFTSVNGVDVFFQRLKNTIETQRNKEKIQTLSLHDSVAHPHFAAIGPKTAEALRVRGIEPFFVPEEFVAEAILPGLGDLRGRWVLLPRAEIARKALPEAIAKAGGIAHEIAVYYTLPAEPDPKGLGALILGVDWITFTSPSTVQNFIHVVREHGFDPFNLPGRPKIACIGPITEKATQEEGFEVTLVAGEFTTSGLISALQNYEIRNV
jgi:uroporphyrinogen III methyltransferase / synthase